MGTLITEPDPFTAEIVAAVHDLEDGRLTRARRALVALWERASPPAGPSLARHRSALAHWLAGAQTDPLHKLAWDERALAEAEAAVDWSAHFAGTGTTIGTMYPELHLELARDHVAADSPCAVLEHLAVARNAVDAVPEARRTRLRKQIAQVDAALRRHAPEREDWGWERDDDPAMLELWDDEVG